VSGEDVVPLRQRLSGEGIRAVELETATRWAPMEEGGPRRPLTPSGSLLATRQFTTSLNSADGAPTPEAFTPRTRR